MRPATSITLSLVPDMWLWSSLSKSTSLVWYPGVSALAMLEETNFWRALTRFINCSIPDATFSSMKQNEMQSGCHVGGGDYQGVIGLECFKCDAER